LEQQQQQLSNHQIKSHRTVAELSFNFHLKQSWPTKGNGGAEGQKLAEPNCI